MKRLQHDETLDLVGKKLPTGYNQRDAVHFAVLPCIAGKDEPLEPGQHVGILTDEGPTTVGWTPMEKCIGIIDPFLVNHAQPGDTVFVFLYPKTIRNLRHTWTIAGVPDEPNEPNPYQRADVPEE